LSLIEKLRNRHFLSLLGTGSMAVVGVVQFGLLYRHLSIVDVGGWVFFLTVFGLIDTFRSGFLSTALIKFYAGTEGQRSKEVIGSVWYLGIVITAALIALNGIAYFLIGYIHDEAIAVVIKWFGITFLFTLPISIASWIMGADQHFGKLLVLRVINQGSIFLFIVGLIWIHKLSLQTVLIANLAGCILTSILCFAYRWTRVFMFFSRTKQSILEVYHFGKYSVGTSISTNLLRSSDSFIIKFMLGTAALGVYSLPMRLMAVIEIPLSSFLATGMPEMSAAYNQGRKSDVAYIMQKYAGMLTLALVPVSLIGIAFANIAVGILGGPAYVGTYEGMLAATALRIFLTFAMFYPIDRFIGVSLDIVHQPKANFIKVLLMLAANIVGDFSGVFIFHNIDGVALATLLPFLTGVGYGYYRLKKHLDFSIAGIFKIGFTEGKLLIKQYLDKKNAIAR
jgi:O-antigen/teichoic acid export membrane protein